MVTKQASKPRTSGKSGAKVGSRTYTPVSDAVAQAGTFADNEIVEGMSRFGLVGALRKAMGRDRRSDAEALDNILVALLAWPLLKAASIHCFCSELCQFVGGTRRGALKKLYDFMGHEDLNWRGFAVSLAMRIARCIQLGCDEQSAVVFDDTIRKRRGAKVEGSSRHWDHTEGRVVFGQQVLEVGVAGEKGYLPIDRQIFTGNKGRVLKRADKPFRDARGASGRDMQRALDEDKNRMFRRMLTSVRKTGIRARYVVADAWFAVKANIEAVIENGYIGAFHMKRGAMEYLVEDPKTGGGRFMTATQIYEANKRRLKAAAGARFRTCSVRAWINLETRANREPRWHEVTLVLSVPAREEQPHRCWAIFLCTDPEVDEATVLRIYALRWSIEVYFKELKQHFGLLAEQSGRYQVSYASIHLAAIRYTLIFEAMLRSGGLSYGQVRDRQSGRLVVLCYAGLLWELFRALIEGALDGLRDTLEPDTLATVLNAIDETVESFLSRALQVAPESIASQLEAEAAGYL